RSGRTPPPPRPVSVATPRPTPRRSRRRARYRKHGGAGSGCRPGTATGPSAGSAAAACRTAGASGTSDRRRRASRACRRGAPRRIGLAYRRTSRLVERRRGCAKMRPMRLGLVAALVFGLTHAVVAHPLAPCVLEIRETGNGVAEVGWKTPLVQPRGAALEPALPARCRPVRAPTVTQEGGGVWTRWAVDCGTGGLVGEHVGVRGPGGLVLATLVRVTLADGRLAQGVASPGKLLLPIPQRPGRLDLVRD